jgi:transcriptional antiterminator RfaH
MVLPETVHSEPDLSAWYCVRSQPKHEHIATANLRRHLDLDVFHPRIRFKRATKRGPVWTTESLFPNYLFARFDWKAHLSNVQHTGGVAGVVHFGTFWPTVPADVVAELQQNVGEDETRIIEETLRIGEEIHVVGGSFDGFRAIVTRVIPARQRVAVLLEFLGRQTVVELDRSAVKRDSAWRAVRDGYVSAA